jgi:hypothetical protein
MFLDGPQAGPGKRSVSCSRGESQADDLLPTPDIAESVTSETIRVLTLEAAVRMKLTARAEDRVHLQDMVSVGLLDATWLPLLLELTQRMQEILDNPNA